MLHSLTRPLARRSAGQTTRPRRCGRLALVLGVFSVVCAGLAIGLQPRSLAVVLVSVIALIEGLIACAVWIGQVGLLGPTLQHICRASSIDRQRGGSGPLVGASDRLDAHPARAVSSPPTASTPEALSPIAPFITGQALYRDSEVMRSARRAEPGASGSLADDPLFILDPPSHGVTCFILPKEGEPLSKCQDSYALDPARGRYAVTDGVSSSFVPRPWARIVAQGFVADPGTFADERRFAQWLDARAANWRTWMEQRWVPAINAQRAHSDDRPENWDTLIRAKGAQTTLVGCVLVPHLHYAERVSVAVWAVGDAAFFLVRQTSSGWELVYAIPFQGPEQFTSTPLTLATTGHPERTARTWEEMTRKTVTGQRGDWIILASDSLAKWILTQPSAHVGLLLRTENARDFERLVQQERAAGRLEDDDTTLMTIPLRSVMEEAPR